MDTTNNFRIKDYHWQNQRQCNIINGKGHTYQQVKETAIMVGARINDDPKSFAPNDT